MTSEGKRFRIAGKVYDGKSLSDITLEDLIMFDSQSAEAGINMTFDEIEGLADKDGEPTRREYAVLLAVTVWLMRRSAGEDITLAEATKTQLSEIDEVAPTGDRRGPKASKRSSPRKGSARAVSLVEAPADEETPATSGPQSETA